MPTHIRLGLREGPFGDLTHPWYTNRSTRGCRSTTVDTSDKHPRGDKPFTIINPCILSFLSLYSLVITYMKLKHFPWNKKLSFCCCHDLCTRSNFTAMWHLSFTYASLTSFYYSSSQSEKPQDFWPINFFFLLYEFVLSCAVLLYQCPKSEAVPKCATELQNRM